MCSFPEVNLLFLRKKKKKKIITSVDGKADVKKKKGQETCSAEVEKDHIPDY